eukprot:2884565-Rhodomonas_salina.1
MDHDGTFFARLLDFSPSLSTKRVRARAILNSAVFQDLAKTWRGRNRKDLAGCTRCSVCKSTRSATSGADVGCSDRGFLVLMSGVVTGDVWC